MCSFGPLHNYDDTEDDYSDSDDGLIQVTSCNCTVDNLVISQAALRFFVIDVMQCNITFLLLLF